MNYFDSFSFHISVYCTWLEVHFLSLGRPIWALEYFPQSTVESYSLHSIRVSPVYSLLTIIFPINTFLHKRGKMRELPFGSLLPTLGISIPIFKILLSHQVCLWETWAHFESEYGFLGSQFLIVMQ